MRGQRRVLHATGSDGSEEIASSDQCLALFPSIDDVLEDHVPHLISGRLGLILEPEGTAA
jgi:hypothetical protein